MLGAGGNSTMIAAENGLSLTYAHFINPSSKGIEVVADYKKHFQPSSFQKEPKTSIAVFTIIAETTEEAEELALAFDYWMVSLDTAKNPFYFPSVETAKKQNYSPFKKQKLEQIRKSHGDRFTGLMAAPAEVPVPMAFSHFRMNICVA
jgi:alkanesulfonate monooxygenase SsuD/methylene tetrahydromethanopterin reductase-like flavin-dependent oxidoreductase (luciferase family)